MEKTSLKLVFFVLKFVVCLCEGSYLVDAREMVKEKVNCLGGSCMPPVATIIKHKAICTVDNDCKVYCPPNCRQRGALDY
ncbi:unnamed protein product [Eruca vesicaria subsp. sativa]|uniref:Uncharacterized protein n=1 Tax=Eruca vesicaria subsp. sativa TaxID=29727 RepID=A0ABC8L134_ERUVS|nr:unnamed protein product [Eruca vesicaria subsp. sativa]